MFQWTNWREWTIIVYKEAELKGQYLALHFLLIGEPTQTIDRQVFYFFLFLDSAFTFTIWCCHSGSSCITELSKCYRSALFLLFSENLLLNFASTSLGMHIILLVTLDCSICICMRILVHLILPVLEMHEDENHLRIVYITWRLVLKMHLCYFI